MAARSVYTLSRRQQWQYTINAWLPGMVLGLLGVGVVVYLFCIAPNGEMADVRGAALHRGTGVVSFVTNLPVTRGKTDPGALVAVVLAGDTVTFRSHADLHKGEAVQVTYRVGKSGHIHIDDIEPEGKAKP